MYSLVEGFGRLFTELGGTITTDASVAEILITEGRAHGVRTDDGRAFAADIVVSNADVANTYREMIAPEWRRRWTDHRVERMRYSMSSFLLYLGLDRHYDKFKHHTILIGDRYRGLVNDIFGGRMAEDFSIYLHAPTMTDPSMAPPGHESVYLLVPVPHLGSDEVDWQRDGDIFRDRIVNYLEHDFGLKDFSKAITVEHRFTPLDFERELGAYLGTGWQMEPTLFQSAYFRPHNRSEDVRGLYIAGAGTHPGAGLPGVLLSAEITAGTGAERRPRSSAPHRAPIVCGRRQTSQPSQASGERDDLTGEMPDGPQRELLISRRFNMCSMCQIHPDDDHPFAYALWAEGGPCLFCCAHCVADGHLFDFVQWATTLAAHGEFQESVRTDWRDTPAYRTG